MTQTEKHAPTTIDEDQDAALKGLLSIADKLGIEDQPKPPVKPTLEEQAVEIREKEFAAEINKKKRAVAQEQKEAKDRRSQLLNAVRVSAPEINKPLVETFERLSLEKHQFAQRELVRLFQNDAQLQSSLDFFDLSLAQREDLLDRIGFYKGIVIDHSLSNPVETGFREVLKRQDDPLDGPGTGPCEAATLLYRKPSFSGYFENYYTSSESLHQVQKNGVTNIKASLSVVAGTAATVGVGASAAYHNAEKEGGGELAKKIYTTANFFLPKVELSFDESKPCASDEFTHACEQALARPTVDTRFSALLAVLASFGHFVSTQTLVGGRLFATDVKEFTGTESDSSMTTRFAGQIKVGLQTYSAEVQAEVSAEHGTQNDKRAKSTTETQTFSIHAVGGEGTVVEQAGRWAESLYEYKRWAAVQREKLIPSIEVLGKDLRELAWATLQECAKAHTAMHLVEECHAYFLFYGAYDVSVGRLAQPDLVTIRHLASKRCLSIAGETPQSGGLTGKVFDGTRQVVWRVTADGHLVSAVPVTSGFPGRKRNVDFALTVVTEKARTTAEKDSRAVGLRVLGSSDRQGWVFTGGGEIYNTAIGPDYVLSMTLTGKAEFKARTDDGSGSHLWEVEQTNVSDLVAVAKRERFAKLVHPSGLVLSIEGAEASDKTFGRQEQRRVLLQPDIGGRHQLWTLTDDRKIRSAITIAGEDLSEPGDVFLTVGQGNRVLAQGQNGGARKIELRSDTKVVALDDLNKEVSVGAAADINSPGQAVGLTGAANEALSYVELAPNTRPSGYLMTVPTGSLQKSEYIATVDKRELIVDGYLVNIEFIVERRGKGRLSMDEYSRLRMRIGAQTQGGIVSVTETDEPDKDAIDRDWLFFKNPRGEVAVDERFLILPEGPIYSIRLITHSGPVKRLAFEYRAVKGGAWLGLSADHANAVPLDTTELRVPAGSDSEGQSKSRIRAIGLDYDVSARTLRPKVLRRIVG